MSGDQYTAVNDSFLVSLYGPEKNSSTATQSSELSEAVRILREATRSDVPLAQQRHLIQEHQRSATNALTNAFVSLRQPEEDSILCEPISDSTANMRYLKECLAALLSLLFSVGKGSGEVSSVCESLMDSIAVTTSWYLTNAESNGDTSSRQDVSILGALSKKHVDIGELGLAVTRASAFAHSDPLGRSRKDISSQLTEAVMEGSVSKVAGLIEEAVHHYVLAGCSQSHRSESLLPVPSSKATLSPEIIRWAQGLRSKSDDSLNA